MSFKNVRLISMLVLSILVVSGLYAQSSTSGSITGTVTDNSAPLPGVSVELKSPSLQGAKTEITDSNGKFRFSLLNPGIYSLTATLSGFSTARTESIQVGLGRTVTLDVRMNAQLSEQITVTGAAPVVDVTSAVTGVNLSSKEFGSLPIARGFYAVAQIAPGTNSDDTGTTFYGSTGAENQYIIDGLNTTGVEHGVVGKLLNFDFIEEVEVLTGGLPAEYGRITGGIINAITKSGGNEYHGGVFGFQSGGDLRSDNDTYARRSGTTTTVVETDEQSDYGFDLGGFLLKDRLWFFAVYDRVSETQNNTRINAPLVIPGSETFPVGSVFETDVERDSYAGKLTFRLSDNQTIAASIFGDPTVSNGPQFVIAGPPASYLGTRETGGDDYIARYSGIFGGSLLINANYGTHHEDDKTTGPGESIPQTTFAFDPATGQPVVPAQIQGGFGFYQNQEFDRDVYKLEVAKFLGNHQIKVGGDYEDVNSINDSINGGAGQRILILKGRPGRPDLIYYRHRYFLNDLAPGFDRSNSATWQIANPLSSAPHTQNTSFYIQDSWRVLSNLTLNFGVRREDQKVFDRLGDVSIDLTDNYSPRFGLIWDVTNNGRSKLYANYGRFYESIPQDINIRSFGGEISCFCYNLSPDPANFQPDASVRPPGLLGGSVQQADPNLEGQYIDEYLLGYEFELRPQLAVGVKATYRNLGQVIEDMLTTTGDYFTANPGQGIGREAVFYDGVSFAPALAPKREFTAVELSARKRFSNNYQLFASYVWSELEGNYDGTFQASTGQLDPNLNSGYDYADFSVNNEGKLSNDRTHQLKLDGSYTFAGGMLDGFSVGFSTHYQSGTPLTAAGYSIAYGNWEYYLTERGELGRGPDSYEADLRLGYPIKFSNDMRLNLSLSVFNLLDRQAETAIDNRYNRIQDAGPCPGIPDALCNGDGGLLAVPGTTQPLGRLDNPRATAPNPDFLTKGTAFTQPRSIRVGVRLTF